MPSDNPIEADTPSPNSTRRLQPSRQKQDNQNNDDQAGTSSQEVVSGPKSIAATAQKQKNEQNKDNIHKVPRF